VSPASPAAPAGLRLLPAPVAGAFNDTESVTSWQARRDRQKQLGRNGNGIGTPLAIAVRLLPTPIASDNAAERAPQPGGLRPSGAKRQIGLPEVITCHLAMLQHDSGSAQVSACSERLLPTPDTGTSPHGHGRRAGRPGNGHQSGKDLDAAARTLTAPGDTATAVAWGEYEPAIRRWEQVLGQPAPPPAEPGPGGRPRLSAAFAEWMMGVSLGVKCPTSAFVQFMACSLGPSCARQVSRTCAGGFAGLDRTWLASVPSGAAFGPAAWAESRRLGCGEGGGQCRGVPV
jgi:DNA (cytosine-5)-methyltransferase 1